MRSTRSRFLNVACGAAALLTMAGCASRTAPELGPPAADPKAVEAALLDGTVRRGARQATFGWELNEQGTRLRGRGVVRYESPERLRIDLFGPRGETYLSAALVGNEYRLPRGVADAGLLPPAAFLWGALGVARPPSSGVLRAASETPERLSVRYALPGEELLTFEADRRQDRVILRSVELRSRSGQETESLDLEWGAADAPTRARYRDWEAYRELTFTVESVKDAGVFPEAIWNP